MTYVGAPLLRLTGLYMLVAWNPRAPRASLRAGMRSASANVWRAYARHTFIYRRPLGASSSPSFFLLRARASGRRAQVI
jgi:hypothetical protein